MIKINLCPVDELESPLWWVPDAVVGVMIALAAFFGVEWHLGKVQQQIDEIQQKTVELKAQEENLKSDLQRFESMEKDERDLTIKVTALQKITVSKISKFKPLIVIEHLANLRPEGIWYQNIRIGEEDRDSFRLSGQGLDNILVAELLSALKSTNSQEVDGSDLRTMVYFDSVKLEQTAIPQTAPNGFPELKEFPEFSINGFYAERSENKEKPLGTNISEKSLNHEIKKL